MSWKTVATVLIVIFSIALIQSVLAGPTVAILNGLNATGDYSDLDGADDDWNGNDIITSLAQDWFDMGLVAMFGVIAWGVARVLRRELTRGRNGGGGL